MSQGAPEYLALKQNLSCFNNILKKQIRHAKQLYYYETFEKYKNDIKNTWKTISGILSKSSKTSHPINEIKVNNNTIADQAEICNSLNDFFVDIGPNLALHIKPSKNIHYTSYLNKWSPLHSIST